MEKLPTKYLIITGITAFTGFLDSIYLTLHHYSGVELGCNLITGCDVVTRSSYATIFSIPLALLGVIFYATVLFLTVLSVDQKKKKIYKLLAKASLAGLPPSIYFVAVQAFILKSFCEFCLLSALTSTILFIVGVKYLKSNKRVIL